MICVLNSEFNATHKLTTCIYPEPPQHVKPFIVPDAENQVCQIAENTVGVCILDSLTGEEYYALETSAMHKGTYYCYHVKVGSETAQGHIAQDTTGVKSSGLTCNADDFSLDQEVGTRVSKVSETEQLYAMGTSQYCGSGNSRQGHLKISQDPTAKSSTAVVVEKSLCDYDVTITVPSCGQNRVKQLKAWRVKSRKMITDIVTSSGEVTSTTTTTCTTTKLPVTSTSTTTTTTTTLTLPEWTSYTTPMTVEMKLPKVTMKSRKNKELKSFLSRFPEWGPVARKAARECFAGKLWEDKYEKCLGALIKKVRNAWIKKNSKKVTKNSKNASKAVEAVRRMFNKAKQTITQAKKAVGPVDDDAARYGSSRSGNCANLRKKTPKQQKRRCLKKAGDHCKKTCLQAEKN